MNSSGRPCALPASMTCSRRPPPPTIVCRFMALPPEDAREVTCAARRRQATPAAPYAPPRLLLGNVEVGERALEGLGRTGHRLAEGRVRMDGETDVGRVAAVLDRQCHLADQL